MENLTLEKVVKRRKLLIRYNLWDLPKADDINAWKQQFSSQADKKIAMIALDALIVRSKYSARSAMFYMLSSVLPSIINCNSECAKNFGAIPHDLLRHKNFIKDFKIQRLERPTVNPGGGQSSDNIIRDLRHSYSVNEKYFEIPDDKTPHVLLVDEFSGSGNQAKKAITDWISHISPSIKISVFFMSIHENGLKTLKKKFPRVKFYAVEILGNESCLLHHINEVLNLNSMESAKIRLEKFTERNFIKEKKIPILGYRNMALCFKPPYTACNNMAGVYLLRTKKNKVRLFERGL
jgi:hypothetical protein